MPVAATRIDDLITARYLRRGALPTHRRDAGWALEDLIGRMVEISSASAPAGLTAAMGVVRQAQRSGEITAWITADDDSFFPPDAHAGGIELARLPVLRLPSPRDIPLAADKLLRSGGFGLVVMDLASGAIDPASAARIFPKPLQSRVAGLARKHGATALLVTGCRSAAIGLGPMLSLKGEARRTGRRQLELRAVKDRLNRPGWIHQEACRAPAGLR